MIGPFDKPSLLPLSRMRILPALFVAIVLAILPACPTTPDGGRTVDRAQVALELDLISADLRDVSTLVSDEQLGDLLEQIADALQIAHVALNSVDGELDGFAAIELALAAADQLVDSLPEDDQQDVRAAMVVVRAGLRRIKAYWPAPSAPPADPVAELAQ